MKYSLAFRTLQEDEVGALLLVFHLPICAWVFPTGMTSNPGGVGAEVTQWQPEWETSQASTHMYTQSCYLTELHRLEERIIDK